MTERSGPLSVQETYGNGRGDPRPVALPEPTTASDIMGAHWTLSRQDQLQAPKTAEELAYEPVVQALRGSRTNSLLDNLLHPSPYQSTAAPLDDPSPYNRAKVWQDIAQRRAADPSFLADVPATNAKQFSDWVHAQELKRRQSAQSIVGRQSGAVQNVLGFGSDIVSGLADPINLATLPIGGGGKTLLQTMGREALVNGLTETAQLPFTAHNRAQFGEDMTPIDMAADVGIAALGGAVLPGVLHGAGKAASATSKAIAGSDTGQAVGRALAPLALRMADLGKVSDGDVATAFSKAVPAEIRTPDQQAALHVIERQGEVDAANPYVDTPAARDLHADRLETALAAIQAAGDPDAVAPPLTPRTPISQIVSRGTAPLVTGDAAVSTVMARIGHVENATGGGNVRNPRSSATGKYQFTDHTWLNYYKRELGAGSLSDPQILAKRADGATQDRLMQSLTRDNARFLHSIGQPETAGNLYLAHFAGTGGARRILEAEAGTPIERVLSPEAISANPFLRGKTAGDVVDWAHAKMGEAPIGADRVRMAMADGGDEAVRLAQQELDSATLEAAAARARAERADAPIDTAINAVPHIDPADEIALKADPVAPTDGAPVPRETVDHVPRDGPRSARDENGTAASSGAPNADILANRKYAPPATPDMALARLTQRLDRIAEEQRGGVGMIDRRDYTDRVLHNDAVSAGVPLITARGTPRLASAVARDLAAAKIGGSTVLNEEIGTILGNGAMLDAARRSRPEISEAEYRTELAAVERERGIDPGAGMAARAERGLPSEAELRDRILARRESSAEDARSARISTDERIAGFDRPDDTGATTQIDSLEHDARIAVAADPEMTVTLEENGAGVRLADVLADLDDDAAAIEAARRCL